MTQVFVGCPAEVLHEIGDDLSTPTDIRRQMATALEPFAACAYVEAWVSWNGQHWTWSVMPTTVEETVQ